MKAAELSLAEARRVALAAQGFAGSRKKRRVDAARLAEVLRTIGVLQLDFVNVLVPAHYLIPFSRVGPYDRKLLDEVIYRRGEFVEHVAHEASVVPVEHWPLLRQRLSPADRRVRALEAFLSTRAAYAARIIEAVRSQGPLAADGAPAPDEPEPERDWWGWSVAKATLEGHFHRGTLAVAGRRADFSRMYDLAERVIPNEHVTRRVTIEDAERTLLTSAAHALGVGTAADLADYYRLPLKSARRRVAELASEGVVREVRVEGWRDAAFLWPSAKPRAVSVQAVLSPFDPLVWYRPRVERLFGFDYRIEIYVPREKRRWGYYVLPFLFGDRLVARVDLKADRTRRELLVLAAHGERGVKADAVAEALAEELRSLADWLGLDAGIVVERRGNLAKALSGAILAKQTPRWRTAKA
jgi:uncharacterized protein YcaQ